jgi:hypothetical protein
MADIVLEIRRRDSRDGRLAEPLASPSLEGSRVAIGTIPIDVAPNSPPPAVGDELEVCLRAFLYEPAPGIYRISNEPTCRLSGR